MMQTPGRILRRFAHVFAQIQTRLAPLCICKSIIIMLKKWKSSRWSKNGSRSFNGETDSQTETLYASENEQPATSVLSEAPTPESFVHKIVIGVDFGTTYTGA
jgi:hypothetical protein